MGEGDTVVWADFSPQPALHPCQGVAEATNVDIYQERFTVEPLWEDFKVLVPNPKLEIC